ncbi:hypothetical protein J6590_083499 [Homalodisca vitripennis]|nr:hypothetical protein J6590_083499 [Homalodisca vitripennis]
MWVQKDVLLTDKRVHCGVTGCVYRRRPVTPINVCTVGVTVDHQNVSAKSVCQISSDTITVQYEQGLEQTQDSADRCCVVINHLTGSLREKVEF